MTIVETRQRWHVTDGPFCRLTDDQVKAIGTRLKDGCPTQGVSLSPWAVQLLADALNLYGHCMVLSADVAKTKGGKAK